MLPAPKPHAPSLADVLPSCLASIGSGEGKLGLPPAERALVVLVDGLGADVLSARSGHARTLARGLGRSTIIESGFPSTTAAGIASLTTGALPGSHGLFGYSVLEPDRDRVVNQLTGWDSVMDPLTWQPLPTQFEIAVDNGWDAVAIGPRRYSDSGFTQAVLRGARYLSGETIEDRVDRALAWLRQATVGVGYLYVPELDVIAHAKGVESAEWTSGLELVDSALRRLAEGLGPRDGLIVTADHGVLDVPRHAHVLIDEREGLLDGVRHVAGEPRCLQLHLDGTVEPDAVLDRWRDAEGGRAWIASRAEVEASGWWGTVTPSLVSRAGDIFVAARKAVAYYDSRTAGSARSMIGQHGSLSPAELRVPLLRFGAFA